MRRATAALLLACAALAVTAASAQKRSLESGASRMAARPASSDLPAPDAPLPRDAAALASALAVTTRSLRAAVERWDGAAAVPRDVTYLALHHQRILRTMASRRALGDATLARLPRDVAGEARDTVARGAALRRSPAR